MVDLFFTIVMQNNKKFLSARISLMLAAIIVVVATIIGCTSANGARIYVANEGDGTLSVIDEISLKVIKNIRIDGMPHNVNVDPLGRYIYATNHEEDVEMQHDGMGHIPYLRIIDANGFSVLHSIPMEETAAHVVPSRDGKFVYVSREGGNTIAQVDVEKESIIGFFKVGDGPHGILLSNDGKKIYSPNMKSNDISIVDVETGNVEYMNIEFSGNKCDTPVAIGITIDDKFAFVTCGKSFDIYKIDAQSKNIVDRVAFKKGDLIGPIQTPVYPNSRFLYVPDMRNGVVHKIDIEKFELVNDIPSGLGAHGIAYSADGKRAYVTNTWEDSLSAIDLETDSVINTIKVGTEPNGVAVSNGRNQGW